MNKELSAGSTLSHYRIVFKIGDGGAFAADALPLKNDFIRFSMPANFIEDLNDHIQEFEAALILQQTGRGTHVRAKAGINDSLEDALDAIRQLDAIVPNLSQENPEMLAAWTSAHRVERAARRTEAPSSQPTTPGP